MAVASGLHLVSEQEKNAADTSTLGTGMLMVDAISRGVDEIILCIGGSATNDGGMGIAHALGYRFVKENGAEFLPVGKNLHDIRTIIITSDRP